MKMKRIRRAAVMAAAIAAVAVGGAFDAIEATTLVPSDVATLARDAQVIARGRVVEIDAQWADGRRRVETIVTMEIDAALKGSAGRTLQFKVPGGQIGRYRSLMVGAPSFGVGQQLIVFLGGRAPSIPVVLGLSQGVFRLSPGAGGMLVMPNHALARMSGGRPMPLAEFERQVGVLSGGSR
jgi:hypothetical protein